MVPIPAEADEVAKPSFAFAQPSAVVAQLIVVVATLSCLILEDERRLAVQDVRPNLFFFQKRFYFIQEFVYARHYTRHITGKRNPQ